MSQTEDPPVVLARLLKTQMRVIRDDGALASINVSGEWQNSDALKDFDGQVTVGLVEATDQKLDLTGKIRRRTASLRVNVWTTDMPNAVDNGKTLRRKIVDEVNRVIHENRVKPNQTDYDFVGVSVGEQGCRAFGGEVEAVPSTQWSELSDSDYSKLWYSDGDRCQISVNESGEHAVLLFRFRIESPRNTVKGATLSFEGFGTASGGSGFNLKAWNHNTGTWQHAQTSEATQTDTTVTIALTSDLPQYIDQEGYLWLIAETANPSDGQTPATLCCDYASCSVVVNGVTYCDLAGYRNLDRTDIKPFVYRTELSVKSWFIENIGV